MNTTNLCTPKSNATTLSTYLSWKMSWAVTWSFFLMASVSGKRVFILERGVWHLAVTSMGVSSIFKICCWIGGRGSSGCKVLCSRHCGKGLRFLIYRCRHHTWLHYAFLIRDPPHLVWEGSVIPTLHKWEQRDEPRTSFVSRTWIMSKNNGKTDPSLAGLLAEALLEKSLIL